MFVIPLRDLHGWTLADHELSFLDAWFGLTHWRSLDSFRARCMNSRTLVREICNELAIGLINDEEFATLCREALSRLQEDKVINQWFSRSLAAIQPLLEKSPSLKPKSDNKADRQATERELSKFSLIAEDFSAILEKSYLKRACETLLADFKSKSSDALPALVGSILSDLVAQGWTLDALFGWHKALLRQQYSFESNVAFMLKQLLRPPSEYQVTLRITGGGTLGQVIDFDEFQVSRISPIGSSDEAMKAFCDGTSASFATITIRSVDFGAAAVAATNRLEPLLDALRFQYEPRLLQVDSTCYVIRIGDKRRQLTLVNSRIPNPPDSLQPEEFAHFSGRLGKILHGNRLDALSSNCIETALRRYRYGRDAESLTDKFLNWWMGLEVLANVEGRDVGKTVTRRVSHAMLSRYLHRIVADLVSTLRFLQVRWKPEFSAASGVASLGELDVSSLVRLLRDEPARNLLLTDLSGRTIVRNHLANVAGWIADPKLTHAQLTRHRNRLHSHIDRLYRIRCCIVHGAPVRFELSLFAANLEYYLKQTLILVLDSLSEHEHIRNLPGLFSRCEDSWKARLEALDEPKASLVQIDDAIFATLAIVD